MKKLLTLCIILSITTLAVCFSGCSSKEYTSATYAATEEVTAISIDVEDRKVVFGESTDNKVSVSYYYNDKENYNFTVTGEVLSISQNNSKEWYDFFGTSGNRDQRVITVYLPESTLKSLSVQTTNFDIVLPGIAISGDCSLYSNGGSVQVGSLLVSGTTSLSAKDGNVSGNIVGTYEEYILDITIKKGDSNLVSKASGSKLLKVNVNNGDIDLQFVTA
ncbi:MAG: DUF4097 domain-containing protein [Clostridia bacterium]|nr:DUF4097 domain-containing protein [Clostridia bacterium]